MNHGPAVHYAYNLGSCKALGLEEGCDLRSRVSLAVLIGLNSNSASFSFVLLTENSAITMAEVVLKSEEEGRGRFLSPREVCYCTGVGLNVIMLTVIQSYLRSSAQKVFEDQLLTFISANTHLERPQIRTIWQKERLRSEIRAVAVFGDASPEDFGTLKDILSRVFSFLPQHLIHDTVEPSSVLALGVSKLAKEVQDFPGAFGLRKHVMNDSDLHDEL